MQLTYGEYDVTAPRWSPDGSRIGFISNGAGNTGIELTADSAAKAVDGAKIKGTGNKKIGNGHLRWALGEAACLPCVATTTPSSGCSARPARSANPRRWAS